MGCKHFVVALSMIAGVTSPLPAAQHDHMVEAGAPAAPADARYCLRIEAITGSRIERVLCETRAEWWELGVDVDKEWAEEGVRVVPARVEG